MNKKIIITILIAVLALVAAGASWYLLVFNKSNQATSNTEAETEIPEEKIIYLTSQGVIGPVLAFDNLSIWYFEKGTSKLLRQHLEDLNDIREFPLPNHEPVEFATWPDTGGDFIVGNSQNKFLYNATTNEFIPYPQQVKFIQWLPGGQKVAYIWSDQTGTFLSTARSDMSGYTSIAKMSEEGFRFSVSPNGRSFMAYSGSGQKPLYYIIDSLGVPESMTENTAIVNGKFSSDGTKFAFVTADDKLNVLELNSRKIVPVCNLNGANSFVWSNDNNYIYCGGDNGIVKKSLASGLDLLIKNTTGLKTAEMILAEDEKHLFFIESGSEKLGRIRLDG